MQPAEKACNGGRDRKMHREILESGKYPEIIFTPNERKARSTERPIEAGSFGTFRLHGQDHDMTLAIDHPTGRPANCG